MASSKFERLFTANHLMIKAFHLHPVLFFLILSVEYLQMAYFAMFDLRVNLKDPQPTNLQAQNNLSGSVLAWDSSSNLLRLANYQLLVLDLRGTGSL